MSSDYQDITGVSTKDTALDDLQNDNLLEDDAVETGQHNNIHLVDGKDNDDDDDLQFVDNLEIDSINSKNSDTQPVEEMDFSLNAQTPEEITDAQSKDAINSRPNSFECSPEEKSMQEMEVTEISEGLQHQEEERITNENVCHQENHLPLENCSNGYSNSNTQTKTDLPSDSVHCDTLPNSESDPSTMQICESQSIDVEDGCKLSQTVASGDVQTESSQTQSSVIVVKHCIDGFLIEESTEPFPVHRSSLLTELQKRTRKRGGKKRTVATPVEIPTPTSTPVPSATPVNLTPSHTPIPFASSNAGELCSLCGQECLDLGYYRGKIYCSRACIRKFKRNQAKDPSLKPKRGRPFGALTRNKPTLANSGRTATVFRYGQPPFSHSAPFRGKMFSDEVDVKLEPQDPTTSVFSCSSEFPSYYKGTLSNHSQYRREDVMQWTINDVGDYIQCLDGCSQYAKVFETEEIDGRALLLLTEDHLLNALEIKLGPALKIYDKICSFI